MIGIEHTGIYSKNIKELKKWYEDFFGWKTVYDNGKNICFLKADNGAMIEFVQTDEDGADFTENTEGIRHIAIWVDDFEAMVKKVKESGLKIVRDKLTNDEGVSTMFFCDPDGNVLHFIHRTKLL